MGVSTEHTPGGAHVLVTVPKAVLERREDAAERVTERLETEPAIVDVEQV